MDFSKYKNYFFIILALVILYLLSSKAYENRVPSRNEEFIHTTESVPILKLYYANWCGWSKKFLPTWEQLENKIKNIKFVKIDCEANKNMCDNIPGYPFLILEKNGTKINYNGDRSYDDIVNFLKKN